MKKCVLILFVAATMLGCGDDDEKTLIKWDCSGGCKYSGACAATESEAVSASGCTGSSYGDPSCTAMGDICACPDGASSCGIFIPVN